MKKKPKKDKFKDKKITPPAKTTFNEARPAPPILPNDTVGRKIYEYVMSDFK